MRVNNKLITLVALAISWTAAYSFSVPFWPFPPEQQKPVPSEDPELSREVVWGEKDIKHLRLAVNSDPSNSVTILWTTNSYSIADKKAYLSKKDFGMNTENYELEFTPEKITNYRGLLTAVVKAENLEPNTKYYFVVKDDREGKLTKRYWFKTASDKSTDPLYVVAGGDSRNNRVVRRKSNIMVKKLRPDFVFFGGDFTARGSRNEWNKWFDDWTFTYGDDGKVTPIVAARGNHEYTANSLELLFNGAKNMYYDVPFHGDLLNLYVLNTEISMAGDQLNWLKSAITKSENFTWNSSIYHRTMRPHSTVKEEGWQQYRYWAPLFYVYNMDLVIESDTHVMKVTWPLKPSSEEGNFEGFVRDDHRGTVYIGEGTWGAPLKRSDDPKPWTRAYGSVNQVKWLKITKDKMAVRTVLSENATKLNQVEDAARFEKPSNLMMYEGDGGEIELKPKSERIKDWNQSQGR